MKAELTLIPNISIHPNKICTYFQPHWHPYKPIHQKEFTTEEINQSKISHIINSKRSAQGNVSDTAKRKMSRATDYLLVMSDQKKVTNRMSGKQFKFRIAFITLTLPSRQSHSDNEIKNTCLNQFIIEIKKRYKVKNYIWRAEKQENGNIHFHILIDRFIPYQELRDKWNRIINKLGYVDRYRQSQEKWHKKGFRIRAELLPTWNKEKQFQAYLRGSKLHWNSPNSTDVHSIKKIQNVKLYIQKYMAKSSGETEKLDTKLDQLSKYFIKEKIYRSQRKKLIQSKRLRQKSKKLRHREKVSGRIWGCNQELSNIKGFKADVDSLIWDSLNEVIKLSGCNYYHDSYFDVYYINFDDLPKFGGNLLFKYFCSYLMEKFNYSYQSKIAA